MRIAVVAMIAGTMCLGAPASADVFSSKNRSKLFTSQKKLLDSRASKQYHSSARLQPPKVVTPTKWDDGSGSVKKYRGRYKGPFLQMARAAADKHGIPQDLFLRLVHQESRWNPKAVSHAGAIGLAQLMPGTARLLRVDPTVPAQNLEGGARYLKQQYQEFGTWHLALAAYNAGPGAVKKYGGIPPFRETKNYVRIIAGS
ncbi:lytic transglycosylase domain-containing protein [Sulfitobacter sp. F26169L]|uniref:lytic transglycosylase domain-containing protein n=1 Tax=Sulfitobacter sp. F26169L TaxID=2996015 RepID=UPI002260F4FC|nr:lytic transglycosylase domain-containing protein [Sulfitobacter sp. F26169L]MCX7565319.1 lytic transglycosylase domain-containing protein [Sulfitobacter sp. F26169L]